jgi:phosphoribosylanthranilate isomerase
MNNLKIKICGLREPENIKAICALKPDYIGFIFYQKSKRFVTDKEVKIINGSIPESIQKVGVFVNELFPDIVRRINLFGLDYVQLHGDESPGYCSDLKSIGVKIIKSIGIDDTFDFKKLEDYNTCCDYFLLDTKSPAYGGTGHKFNWKKLSDYDLSKPVFLSGGIGPEDAEEIKKLPHFKLHALDLNSKFEIEPALKDTILLEKFIKEIRKNTI